MRRPLSLVLSAAAIGLVPQPAQAAAPTGMVPGGSYLDSCRDIVFDAAKSLLYATCTHRDPEGIWAKGEDVRSSEGFDVSYCVDNSIFNDDGSLYCFAKAPWGHKQAIPEGSYRASCTRSRVVNNVLIAQCDDRSDETTYTQLNLNECRWGGDIANVGGHLSCEKLAAGEAPSSAPLVKPVSIAPGIVKPVTIAPVTAPPGGAGTAPEETRKKGEKKKRDRGQRG